MAHGAAPREGADTHRGRRTAFLLICLLGPSREADWGPRTWPPARWHGLCLEQLSLRCAPGSPSGPTLSISRGRERGLPPT